MDRLRSPGGCPWDAEQTHESVIKYLLEESYEFIDSVDAKDRDGMREELGDVLLQVYFHSRIAEDHPTDPFSIEDVARAVADKLIRRHPHVFNGLQVSGNQEIIDNWEEIKAKEKGRTSALDGVALAQPALPLVEKLLYRAEKYRVEVSLPKYQSDKPATEESVGQALASIIAWARDNEIDPENALRLYGRQIAEQIKAAESR
jgi:XTP/dITP diphosphohydrolase